MQFFQERCWVVVTGCHENESCSKCLNFMERLETVAAVKPWEDTGSNKSLGCVFSEKPADYPINCSETHTKKPRTPDMGKFSNSCHACQTLGTLQITVTDFKRHFRQLGSWSCHALQKTWPDCKLPTSDLYLHRSMLPTRDMYLRRYIYIGSCFQPVTYIYIGPCFQPGTYIYIGPSFQQPSHPLE